MSSREIAARVARSFGSRGGASTADLLFPLIFPPTLISVTPNTGLPGGGTLVDLAGMNFQPGASVTFDGNPATVITVTPSHITATTPAHASGSVNVTVTNPDLQSSTLVNGFTYLDPVFVAVGGAGTISARSTDGLIWTQELIPSGTYTACAWNGLLFCAVGSAGIGATSPDGITWTPVAIGAATENYSGIAWNGSIFCVVGTDSGLARGISRTSSDGTTWTARVTINGSFADAKAIVWNGTIFCAVGAGGSNRVVTSSNGIGWTLGPPFTSCSGGNAIAWNGSLFVVPDGSFTTVNTSINGTTWAISALPSGGSRACVWNGSVFFVAGGNTNGQTSPDGTTWATHVTNGAYTKRGLAFGIGLFVLVGDSNQTNTSPTGSVWTAHNAALPVSQTWNAVTFKQ